MHTHKPTLINVIAWMTLVSGIVNLFWGIAALSTFIGLICAPFSIMLVVLGIFELIYAAKLLSNPAQPIQPSTKLAFFEVACVLTGNVFSMAVGILSLVFYNDLVVKEYFARLNGTLAPVTVTPVEPASITPEPAPVIEELAPAEVEIAPPPAEEPPSKPKRTPRKVAKK